VNFDTNFQGFLHLKKTGCGYKNKKLNGEAAKTNYFGEDLR
jgi:hypothetical protein